MTILKLQQTDGGRRTLTAPLCIIGGGIAGLLVARQIARNGQRVVVIESGDEQFDGEIHSLNEIDDPAGRFSRALTGRYRGLGGSSSRWGGRMIPLRSHDTGARAHVDQPAWPIQMAELDKHSDDIQRLFGLDTGSFEDIPWATAAKFPRNETTLTPRWAKCPSFKRCNIATLLADELRQKGNVDVWLGATVCDFIIDRERGRLSGIVARNLRGDVLEVRAEQFVFAAGTIETTRLLMMLDVASGYRISRRSHALGCYFQDHLEVDVATIDRSDARATNMLFGYQYVRSTRRDLHLELSHAAQRADRVGSGYFFVAMDVKDDSPLGEMKKVAHGLQRGELQFRELARASSNIGLMLRAASWRVARRQLFVPPEVDFRLVARIEQLPQRSNRIRLSENRDRMGAPKALLEWGPTRRDERCFRSAIANLEAYWRTAGFDKLCPLKWSPHVVEHEGNVADQAKDCAHPSGTTRMGTNAAESVVGPDLRCHSIPNVAIASASVFPTAGSANPTFTLMKLALSLGDSYRSKWMPVAATLDFSSHMPVRQPSPSAIA